MPTDADLEAIDAALIDNAQGPQSVTTDAGTVVQHSLADQIELDAYLNQKAAASKRGRGLRFTKLIGPEQCPASND